LYVAVLQFAICCFQHSLATLVLLFVTTDLPDLVDMQAAQGLRDLINREIVIILDREAGVGLASTLDMSRPFQEGHGSYP
jgi:hypothetical protein